MTQKTIASEKASSEYYETVAPGFVGFYPNNFGYDAYGEGDFISVGADNKVYALFENEKTGKTEKYEFTSKYGGCINGRLQEEWEKDIAKAYCRDLEYEFFGDGLAEESWLPPVTKVEFEKVWHPREYNFMNDKIYVKVHVTSKEDFTDWARMYTEEYEEDWDKLLKVLFTRRDGFMPFYSNDPAIWKKKTENYTNLSELGGWNDSEPMAVSVLLQFFLWRESNLWVNGLPHPDCTDWWESLQGSFEMNIVDMVGNPTECHGDTFDAKTSTVHIRSDEAYILKVLKKNHNTESWKLLDEEEE